MSRTDPIITALRGELEVLDKRRKAVEQALRALNAAYDDGTVQMPKSTFTERLAATRRAVDEKAGPTAVFLDIVDKAPGITRPAALDLAVPRVTTESDDIRGALRESLRAMIRRNRLVERDGGLYLP